MKEIYKQYYRLSKNYYSATADLVTVFTDGTSAYVPADRDISRAVWIALKEGGYRERNVLSQGFEIEQETWNESHKVLNFLSTIEAPDGYRSGFQVDIVTNSICG